MKLSKIATSFAVFQDTAGTTMTTPVVFGSTALAISTPTTAAVPTLVLTNAKFNALARRAEIAALDVDEMTDLEDDNLTDVEMLDLCGTSTTLATLGPIDVVITSLAQGIASGDVATATAPTATTLMTEAPVPHIEMTIFNTTEQTADLTKRSTQEEDDYHSASLWEHVKWLLGSW
ncbi:hypothetical protein E4T38_06846 [Aureobasidium subglaciale]|nr:hypothetical protein E4T38_06846 [Aureobasidium subglaciale]KAI5222349.1 hypothetical protein E4T41_06697 [Aureobasidium subglaciale]